MGDGKYEKRKQRRGDHLAHDEIVAAENEILILKKDVAGYKKAWNAEKLLSDNYKQQAERWKSKAGLFALLFWITLGALIVMLGLGIIRG